MKTKTVHAVGYLAETQKSGTLSFTVQFFVKDEMYTVRELYSARPTGWHTVFYSAEHIGNGCPCDVKVVFPWSPNYKRPAIRWFKPVLILPKKEN